ncbi:hypothetical protein C0992_013094 [Termitomyces sp. T32_za158]|nr:hypothetical protein C0992_013094 [Termitomyces sp. T32_za158]
MTPPPTIPTQTLALPPAEVDMFTDLYLHDDWDASPHGQPSASGFPDQNDSMDPPLSPISPEWTTNGSYDMAPSSRNTKVLLCGDRIPEPESLPYYLQEPNDNNTSPHCRPILHRLDIPFPSPNITFSDSPTSPMDFDEELLPTPNTPNMDLDMDIPTTPESLPMSPFVHELAFSRDNRLFENDFRGEKYRTLFEPPPMHELEFLPELDDIPDSPSSPSLRSFSSLPSLYDDDDDDGLTSPPSPGATLLPLPGAEPEDDIRFSSDLDPHLPSGIPASPFGSSSGSLLLLEDEALPRSPSPENCDVDFVYAEDSADPDIRRLGELRRRSLHAERAARQFEQALLEQGAVHQRWEARRARKKEKERGREIGTMLRLKMMQEQDREETVKKGMISSMEQLVAKMLLRRNDTYRTLANRKTPLTSKFHKSSPLVPHDDSADVDMDDQQESWNPRWTSDSESESGPRTLSAWTSSLPQSSSSSF